MSVPYYRECLKRELGERLQRNPAYSLRAFAKTLDVPVSCLSRALSGKRSLSLAAGTRIATKLHLSPTERSYFLSSLGPAEKASSRMTADQRTASADESPHYIDEERFRIISDWYHFAILEMTYLKDFKAEPREIAARLGINPTEASMALTRLKDAGLLADSGRGLQKTKKTIWARKDQKGGSNEDGTSPALFEYQKQSLNRAMEALLNNPFEERVSSTMVMPIDPKKLPLARRMIEQFAIDLCRTLSRGGVSDIYQLNLQFHSLLKKGKDS